jgi:tetratricopeptide (TPR) repeat protein
LDEAATKDPPINDQNLYQAFRKMQSKEFDAAESLLKEGLKTARLANDDAAEGLYFSAMGVLYKLKQDYKKAFKFYQQAEQLLKDDFSIKIIMATLLIEEFHQYDTALHKLDKVLAQTSDPAVIHHARSLRAMAYFLMNKKDQAKENFDFLLAEDFTVLRLATNINFKVVELFIKKGFLPTECKTFLQKALALAQSKKEKVYEKIIQGLLAAMTATPAQS